jgi:hypothetical protein
MERGECIGINRGLPTMIWDMLGRRIQAREPPLQNIRQLEAALHREWQQLSQQDIWHLTGGMRCRVEAVIQAHEGCTQYWTLNNRCRQVIHKWRFEREMTILSCFLNCEGQYLKWTCFTAKTGLVIFFVVSYSQCNVLTGYHCVLEIIWSVISWYLSYHLPFQKNMGVLNLFLCAYNDD